MTRQVKHLYEFGPFLLDVTEHVLRRNGQEIALNPKPYEVLLVLIENSGHIVEKETLMQRGWPDTIVEEANLTQNISVLRKILSEGGDNHQYIETIPKRGYRFTAPVREVVEEVENYSSATNSVPVRSESLAPIYSDTGHADNKGQWMLVISATIKDIDKPIAEAMEAHLRKLSKDVTLTLLRIEEGSVILILEGTRDGFERIRELVESGQLSEIFGFDIKDLRWGLSSERVKTERQHIVQPHPEGLSHRKDRGVPNQGALALAQSAFDQLLLLLGADRDQAGMRYEQIRQALIKFFKVKGAENPEDLADETIDRVVKRIEEGKEIITAHLEAYFFGVARNILRESYRMPASQMLASQMPDMVGDAGDKIKTLECFEKCFSSLSVDERTLLLMYHKGSENSQIRNRKNLAVQLGVTSDSLRLRIYRIRKALGKCISECRERSSADIQKDKKES